MPPKGGAPLPGGRDGLSRSFVHIANCYSVKLYPWSVGANRTTVNWKKKSEATDSWHTLRPFTPGVKQVTCRTPTNSAEENRLVWRTSLSRQTKRSRMGWKVGAGARKVRLLLWIAQVECRLSSAPPISINILWSADANKAISFDAHCLTGWVH